MAVIQLYYVYSIYSYHLIHIFEFLPAYRSHNTEEVQLYLPMHSFHFQLTLVNFLPIDNSIRQKQKKVEDTRLFVFYMCSLKR